MLDSDSTVDRNIKAVKSDNAEVPVGLWNDRAIRGDCSPQQETALETLRNNLLMVWFRKRVFRSFCSYMLRSYGRKWTNRLTQARQQRNTSSDIHKDGTVGIDALERVINSIWWLWSRGSTLIFWRWPKQARRDARDGSVLPWKIPPFPRYVLPQRYPNSEKEKKIMITKLLDPISKGYISDGYVSSLSTFFCVPKGDSDVRIVYDMTKCGINACLWSPRFYLPNPDAVFDSIDYDSWMGDIDQGEMFLNYPVDPELLPFIGVDVTEIIKDTPWDTGNKRTWFRWNRWAICLRQSPFATTRMFGIGAECMFGNRRDKTNVFAWKYVKLNLPGSDGYDPSEPWVSKRTEDGKIPPDAFTFVDDIRVVGRTEEICDAATRRVASSANHLGEQQASRKRIKTSQRTGAWIGAIFRSDDSNIGILTSQEKWDRAKGIIAKWKDTLLDKGCYLNRKELEKDRGFLVHLRMVYPSITPYLKGLHLTLEMWRPDRDSQGWKLPRNDWARLQAHLIEKGYDAEAVPSSYKDAPELVKRAPRLEKDIVALEALLKDDHPPVRVVRSKALKALGVSFVDASGRGKGSSTIGTSKRVSTFFARDLTHSNESSNFREFNNLVETLEKEYATGNLENLEVFICTDNEVTEKAFYKGSSKSPKLFDLVLRLRLLQQYAHFKLHVVHVVGSRMIKQGTDGLLRGLPYEGLLGKYVNF